jgi:MFS family permease
MPIAAHMNSSAPSSTWRAYYALFVLWLVHIIANIDRFSFGMAVQAIKVDLHFSDTEVGVVTGAAFVVAYVTFGIPVARWLDRGQRNLILAWSVGIWSIMAAACGAAGNFLQMVLARAGVGAGESGCVPAAISLIGDYFPLAKRTQAIGIFNSALPAAGIIGSPIMGVLIDRYGWRVALIVFGIVGLFLAALVRFTLREPMREAVRSGDRDAESRQISLAHTFKTMIANRTFCLLLLAHGIYGFGIFAFVAWYPVSIIRTFGISYTELGLIAGTGLGIIMFCTSLASGFFCPAVVRRTGNDRWMAILPAIFCLLSVPAMIVACSDVSKPVSLAAGAIAFGLTIARVPPILGLSITLMPGEMRSMSTVVFLIATNVLGSAIGPIIAGMISDSMTGTLGDAAALRYALMWTAPVFGFIGALLAFLPAMSMPRKLALQNEIH